MIAKPPTYEIVGGPDGNGNLKIGCYYDDLASLERAIEKIVKASPSKITEIYFAATDDANPLGYGFFGIKCGDPKSKRRKK